MRRLTFSLLAVVLFGSAILGWCLTQIHRIYLADNSEAKPKEHYVDMGAKLSVLLDGKTVTERAVLSRYWFEFVGLEFDVIDRAEFPLPDSLQQAFIPEKALILEGYDGVHAHYLMPKSQQILVLSLPPDVSEQDDFSRIWFTLIFYAGISLLILLWLWPLIRDLKMLGRATREYGSGQLNLRMQASSWSYVRELEREFNRMAERIEVLLSDNKMLSRAVSHDLKTPLARLRFGLEALASTENKIQREKYALRVNQDLESMEALVETLLSYARLEDAGLQLRCEHINVEAFLIELLAKHERDTITQQCVFHCYSGELFVDPVYLNMALGNLLVNAQNHAQSQVVVSVVIDDKTVRICFEDDGLGFQPDEFEHLCKPFWRGKLGRERGHGMGLAIVARIAEWLGAHLIFDASPTLGGARVQVCFNGNSYRVGL